MEEAVIKDLLERKNKEEKYIGILNKFNIPLKINPNAPNTMPIKLNKIIKKIETPRTKTPKKECEISSSDYENIKKIINQTCVSFERTVMTFSKLEEEELRDVISSNLKRMHALFI